MSEIVATIVFDDAKLRAYAEQMLADREPRVGHPSTADEIVEELLTAWSAEVALTVDQGFTGVVRTHAEVRRG